MESIKIDVESKDKCYFCGRKKEEILHVINKMEIGIKEAKSSLEKKLDGLDAEFKKKESEIVNEMKGIDLSYKINTIITDGERFKKEIPHYDLWTHKIKSKLGQIPENRNATRNIRRGINLGGAKVEPLFVKSVHDVTIDDAMKSLNSYLGIEKDEKKNLLENQLQELQIIEDSFNQLNLQPLVSMTSKPLGEMTAAWKNYERMAARKGISGVLPASLGHINEPNKFDMKKRIDNVGFVLTVCHFCYDRFQGSTL